MAIGIKGATTELKRQADFLGMTFDQVCTFIENNPYAHPHRAVMALAVYKNTTTKKLMAGKI